MARCKDCIHGEVCDIFVHTRTHICNDRADEMCKLFKPTADVVPKSEVDKTIAGWAYLHADTLNKLENAKVEVAREIFAEIEKIFNKRIAFYTDMAKQSKFTEKHYAETMIKNCEIYLQEIAELKKKYTEGK